MPIAWVSFFEGSTGDTAKEPTEGMLVGFVHVPPFAGNYTGDRGSTYGIIVVGKRFERVPLEKLMFVRWPE